MLAENRLDQLSVRPQKSSEDCQRANHDDAVESHCGSGSAFVAGHEIKLAKLSGGFLSPFARR